MKHADEASTVQGDVMPTFSEWLKQNGIRLTTVDMIGCLFCAKRRNQTVEKFLGYPWAYTVRQLPLEPASRTCIIGPPK